MTPTSELELGGNFLTHPFAELMAEIAQARLTGSLRVSAKEKKAVIYFKRGRIAFAVSNARASRLFSILLGRGKLSKPDLARIPDFANDLSLAAYLEQNNLLTKPELDGIFIEQIEGIICDGLTWTSGDWTFSSLARIRDGLSFDVDIRGLLIDFGRRMSVNSMLSRFRSLEERFSRSTLSELGVSLKPEEAFVLSRADEGILTAASLISVAAMTESSALHAIYTLWLGGLLIRNDWQAAFPAASVALMKNAKLELKKEARLPGVPKVVEALGQKAVDTPKPVEAVKEPEIIITLDEYLERVENAETHYDILGVDSKAEIDELKRAYFALARMFHPDRYHAKGGDRLRRVQNAFTELAQAHETLKSAEAREVYDYRMRKELAAREKVKAAGGSSSLRLAEAEENFERGFSLLMDDQSEAAWPFLARAVHYAPNNARYHAYYGKALSADETQRHKAEAEMQHALKLDSNNPTFRILLAEFFIQFNLMKRAEGELTRLLAVFPSNREARDLLDKLQHQ